MATAQNTHDYFNGSCISSKRYASCHFVVGLQGEIIQLIPETEWSYCTNQANGYSVSIETCHPDITGKFNQATEKSLIELVAFLCKEHGLNPLTDIIRHYDVTKKICPKYYVDHYDVWNSFRMAVKNCMTNNSFTLPSYGIAVNTVINADYCDTTATFIKKLGDEYTFKTGSPITCGTQGIFDLVSQIQQNGYYFTKFQAVGRGGTGFFVNGKRVCVGNVE
jgi:N-acetylmuramoyl-L-alanine amidase CwlA